MEPVTSSIPMMVVEGNHEIAEQIGNKLKIKSKISKELEHSVLVNERRS